MRGDLDDAEHFLRCAHQAHPVRFPVECLNAGMVLAAILAARGDREATLRCLVRTQRFSTR